MAAVNIPNGVPAVHQDMLDEENNRLYCKRLMSYIISTALAPACMFFINYNKFPAYQRTVEPDFYDPRYNETAPYPAFSRTAHFDMISLICCMCALLSVVTIGARYGWGIRKLFSSMLWILWIMVLHVLLLYIKVEILNCVTSILKLYVFSNPAVKKHISENVEEIKNIHFKLEYINYELYKPFCSFRASVLAFGSTYAFLFISYMHFGNEDIPLHYFTLLLMALFEGDIRIYLSTEENPLEEVLMGIILGTVQACRTIRAVRETVF